MTETALQRSIIDALAAVGIRATRVQSGRAKVAGGWAHFAAEGTPDLLLEMYRSSWLEVKTPGGRLGSAQEARHSELARSGARVSVVRSVAAAVAVARAWADEDRRLLAMVREAESLRAAGLEP